VDVDDDSEFLDGSSRLAVDSRMWKAETRVQETACFYWNLSTFIIVGESHGGSFDGKLIGEFSRAFQSDGFSDGNSGKWKSWKVN
jgi:hypothetical protein